MNKVDVKVGLKRKHYVRNMGNKICENETLHTPNDPKFSDRLVLANIADPDQRSSLIWVLTICNTVFIFWMHYCMVKPIFFEF